MTFVSFRNRLPTSPFPKGRRVSYGEVNYNDAGADGAGGGGGSGGGGGGGSGGGTVYQPSLRYNTTATTHPSSSGRGGRSARAQQQQQIHHSIGLEAQTKASENLCAFSAFSPFLNVRNLSLSLSLAFFSLSIQREGADGCGVLLDLHHFSDHHGQCSWIQLDPPSGFLLPTVMQSFDVNYC